MQRGPVSGRLVGAPLLIVGVVLLVTGLVLWIGLGDARFADERTVIVAGFGVVGVVALALGALGLRSARTAERIGATGTAGTARVLSMTQTGTQVNHQPEVQFELLVTLPGREPYPARAIDVIPFILLNRLGDEVLPVRVDPADPGAVVIDWTQPTPAGG